MAARATTDQLAQLQAQCQSGFVDSAIVQYAVDLVNATRQPERVGLSGLNDYVMFGASPRASINLVQGARALAFLRGRAYTTPQDLIDIVPDVLRHRIMLSYEALSDHITTDAVIQDILKALPAPTKPLHNHVQISQTTTS